MSLDDSATNHRALPRKLYRMVALFADFSAINAAMKEGRMTPGNMSKNDYNFQVLLLVLAVILGIAGLAALGALMMFMTAFM